MWWRVALRKVCALRGRAQRAGQVKRDGRDQLEYVLRNRSRTSLSRWTRRRPRLCRVHHTMHPRFLCHALRPTFRSRCIRLATCSATSVPDTSHIVTRYDLCKTAGLDVPNLDEARVEKENVWRMPSDVLGCAFPFDRLHRAAGITVTVDVQTEFYVSNKL